MGMMRWTGRGARGATLRRVPGRGDEELRMGVQTPVGRLRQSGRAALCGLAVIVASWTLGACAADPEPGAVATGAGADASGGPGAVPPDGGGGRSLADGGGAARWDAGFGADVPWGGADIATSPDAAGGDDAPSPGDDAPSPGGDVGNSPGTDGATDGVSGECPGQGDCPEGFTCQGGVCVFTGAIGAGPTGTIHLPAGASALGMVVIAGAQTVPATAAGEYLLTEPIPAGVRLIFALRPGQHFAWARLVVLEAEVAPPTGLDFDAQTTAAALTWLSPLFLGGTAAEAKVFAEVAAADLAVAALGDLIVAHWTEQSPLDADGFEDAHHAAITSVFDALPEPAPGAAPQGAGCPTCLLLGPEPFTGWSIDLDTLAPMIAGFDGTLKLESTWTNPVHWLVEIAEIEPDQPATRWLGWFPSASACAEANGAVPPVSLENNRTSFVRVPGGFLATRVVPSKTVAELLDPIGLMVDTLGGMLGDLVEPGNPVGGDVKLAPPWDRVFVVRAYSGALDLGGDEHELGELAATGAIDAGMQSKAQALNLAMMLLDAVSAFVDVDASIEEMTAGVAIEVMTSLAALEAQGNKPTLGDRQAVVLDAVVKLASKALVNDAVEVFLGKALKSAASLLNPLKELKAGANVLWRLSALLTGTSQVESAVLVVGDPFGGRFCTDCDDDTWQQHTTAYAPGGVGKTGQDTCKVCGVPGGPCCYGDAMADTWLVSPGEIVFSANSSGTGPGVCKGAPSGGQGGNECVDGQCVALECVGAAKEVISASPKAGQFWAQRFCGSDGTWDACIDDLSAAKWALGGPATCVDGKVHGCASDDDCPGQLCMAFPAFAELNWGEAVTGSGAPLDLSAIFHDMNRCVPCNPGTSGCFENPKTGKTWGTCVETPAHPAEGLPELWVVPTITCSQCVTDSDCATALEGIATPGVQNQSIGAMTCNSGFCRCLDMGDCPSEATACLTSGTCICGPSDWYPCFEAAP